MDAAAQRALMASAMKGRYNPLTGKFDLSEDEAWKQDFYHCAAAEAAERQRRERAEILRNTSLDPEAKQALGKLSPQLVASEIVDQVVLAMEDYEDKAQETLERYNLPGDLQDLVVVLAEFDPVNLVNQFHWMNPEINLQRLSKENKPLKVLEGVVKFLTKSDRYLTGLK